MTTSIDLNFENKQIYKIIYKFIETYEMNCNRKDDFHNRNKHKNILLCQNDIYNIIIFSIDSPITMITNDVRALMKTNIKLAQIPYGNNTKEIMITNRKLYSAIYIKSKELFIDIFKLLIEDHPTYHLYLLNGFNGWQELNDELIHYETHFLNGNNIHNYSLTNIDYCSNLKLYDNKTLRSSTFNLMNIVFETVEINYTPIQYNSNNFGILPKNYHKIKIINNSIDLWGKCYNMNIISEEFINKIISLQVGNITNHPHNSSNFIKKLLSSKNFVEMNCCFEIYGRTDINLLISILSNDNITKMSIIVDDLRYFRSVTDNINIQIGNNVEYLKLTMNIKNIIPYTLCFSSESNLKHLITSFPIKCNIDLFNKLEEIIIQSDEVINNISNILKINPEKLICKLCKFTNIKSLIIKEFTILLEYPNMDEHFYITNLQLYPLNQNEQSKYIFTHPNVVRNIVRNQSLIHYSK